MQTFTTLKKVLIASGFCLGTFFVQSAVYADETGCGQVGESCGRGPVGIVFVIFCIWLAMGGMDRGR